MLAASLTRLADRGAEMISAWVTNANGPSEGLLAEAGFVTVTRPLDKHLAVMHYRAAAAGERIDRAEVLAMATEVAEDDAVALWVVADERRDPVIVQVGDVDVTVSWIGPDDGRVPSIA